MIHMKKTSAREIRERVEKNTALIYAALDLGQTTRKKIGEVTGMKLHEIAKLFTEDKELYAAYTVRRKTLVDLAADNLQDIIEDTKHPQHFAATKYVLQKYKSDLDDILETQDDGEVSINLGGKSSIESPIRIIFGKQTKEKKED